MGSQKGTDLPFGRSVDGPVSKKSFQHRCLALVKRADLTVADLHIWFGRPYPTVWRWVNSGWEPRGPQGRRATQRLEILEATVDRKPSPFPVPDYVTSRNRQDYVRGAFQHAERGHVSSARTAR